MNGIAVGACGTRPTLGLSATTLLKLAGFLSEQVPRAENQNYHEDTVKIELITACPDVCSFFGKAMQECAPHKSYVLFITIQYNPSSEIVLAKFSNSTGFTM
jgi:hypothetical protein